MYMCSFLSALALVAAVLCFLFVVVLVFFFSVVLLDEGKLFDEDLPGFSDVLFCTGSKCVHERVL